MYAYHDLLGLCKVVPRVPVQLHFAQLCDGHEFFRHDLGWVEEVEAETELVVFVHDLHAQLDWISRLALSKNRSYMEWASYLPLRKPPSLNSIIKILPHEIRILPRNLLRLLPHITSLPLQPLPMELNQLRGAVISDESERVNTKAVNMPE